MRILRYPVKHILHYLACRHAHSILSGSLLCTFYSINQVIMHILASQHTQRFRQNKQSNNPIYPLCESPRFSGLNISPTPAALTFPLPTSPSATSPSATSPSTTSPLLTSSHVAHLVHDPGHFQHHIHDPAHNPTHR